MKQKLRILLISNSVGTASRIREVIRNSTLDAELQLARNSMQSASAFELGGVFDLVIIPISFGIKHICDLLNGPILKGGNGVPALIAFDEKFDRIPFLAADLFLAGAAGFIAEPYSVDQIVALIELALSPPDAAQTDSRLQRLAAFLGAEAVSLVNESALTRISTKNASGRAGAQLKLLSDKLKAIYEKNPDLLADALTAKFSDAKPFEPRKEQKSTRTKFVNHPGLDLAMMVGERKLDVEQLAPRLGVTRVELQNLFEGKSRIEQPLADKLALILGGTPAQWLKRQSDHDLFVQSQKKEAPQ